MTLHIRAIHTGNFCSEEAALLHENGCVDNLLVRGIGEVQFSTPAIHFGRAKFFQTDVKWTDQRIPEKLSVCFGCSGCPSFVFINRSNALNLIVCYCL